MLLRSVFVVLGLTSFMSAAAPICPKFQPVEDGCTFPEKTVLHEIFRAAAKPYRSVWRNQCNTHDRNYQILGKSKQESDSSFYSDMRSRCDSKFNKYFMPSLNASCRAAASVVYQALKSEIAGDYYTPAQAGVAYYTDITSDNVNSGSCKITPEYANAYDPSLLSQINSTFNSLNNRYPTAYERFKLLAHYTPGESAYNWQQTLTTYSNDYGRKSGPQAKAVNQFSRNTYKKDASSSIGTQLTFDWQLNWGNQSGAVYQKNFMSMYNETYNISGVLEVTDRSNNSDFIIIQDRFRSIGECAPTPDYECF